VPQKRRNRLSGIVRKAKLNRRDRKRQRAAIRGTSFFEQLEDRRLLASVVDNFAGIFSLAGGGNGDLGLAGGGTDRVSSAFQVGGTAHSLDSITIQTRDGSGSPTYQVNVFNDDGAGAPDYSSQFETFAAQAPVGGGYSPVTYTAGSPKQMTPSGRYWVEVQLVTGTQGFVRLEQDTVNAGTGGVFPELGIDQNQAATPGDFGFTGLDLFMQVSGTSAGGGANTDPTVTIRDLNYTEGANPVQIDGAALAIDTDGNAE
jgi:hypothetical protein